MQRQFYRLEKKIKADLYFVAYMYVPYTEINSPWSKYLNPKSQTLKLSDYIEKYLLWFHYKEISQRTQKEHVINGKIINLTIIKFENFMNKSTTGRRYLQFNKQLVAKIYKEFLQIERQKTDNPKGKRMCKCEWAIHKIKNQNKNKHGKDVQDLLVKQVSLQGPRVPQPTLNSTALVRNNIQRLCNHWFPL